jgi:hypothetical protein
MLKRASHRDAQLASQLASVAELFTYRRKGADATSASRNGKKNAASAPVTGAEPAAPSAQPSHGSESGSQPAASVVDHAYATR